LVPCIDFKLSNGIGGEIAGVTVREGSGKNVLVFGIHAALELEGAVVLVQCHRVSPFGFLLVFYLL
jgi:hypothetical protein